MARINLERDPKKEVDDFDEIPAKVKSGRRRRKGRRSFKGRCCLFFLIILILAAIIGAAALAKTGLVSVPVFSDLFYRLPLPERQIDFSNQTNFKAEGFSMTAGAGKNEIIISLTEKELTFLLRQSLASGSNAIFAPNLQAAITNGQVELYGLLQKPLSANLTVNIQPFLTNGRLDYKITEFKVGDLSLPLVIVDNLVNWTFGGKINQFIGSIAENYRFNRLDLTDGKVTIDITAATEGSAKDLINLQINSFTP
jgi:hypothetical protein